MCLVWRKILMVSSQICSRSSVYIRSPIAQLIFDLPAIPHVFRHFLPTTLLLTRLSPQKLFLQVATQLIRSISLISISLLSSIAHLIHSIYSSLSTLAESSYSPSPISHFQYNHIISFLSLVTSNPSFIPLSDNHSFHFPV